MAIYGLFVFLEMPEQLRKGRRRYIAISFVITCLSAFAASLDMSSYFQVLFNSTSPSHWRELLVTNFSNWKSLTSNTVLGIVVWIGDVFLVSVYHHNLHTCHSRDVLHRYTVAM
jgi:hypothetical protein